MFTTSTIATLEEALRYSTAQQKAISSNIANVDTPHYKEQTVSFKDVLQTAQSNETGFQSKRTHAQHLSFPLPGSMDSFIGKTMEQYNHNGNSVDVDKQMTEMAENQIYYNALVDRISGNFQSLEMAIRGSK
ncbi:flagellar basal-body rod protein FlgB [Bacillus sp. JCM 19046]|uniref:Flagellar basal body rod protein FlgB n=1 Tax=Shouchella xiaoxiensis TaxID=766895 RepID=A0ABS2SQ52_9BACI|nr:flagellar basal body rod protein FlgB [Shouchella xiaoxiensis]MBM7837644.1 flagellar basal-body rod protein FlgB [Shouchella xiaoxiensis]GAF12875.1 flagellar basal-body rod protein FlgB [Bacillus sp. JCM 19045]GAF16758.1 flagellar basal-body rod protein FlgB [Bacillus sp. JCM 19046]